MTEEDVRTLALNHFQKFVKKLYHLLVEENRKFDLIIGAGTTGVVVGKLTELVYQNLNIACPPILQLPVLRYKGQEFAENLFDNSVLYPEVTAWLSTHNIQKLDEVLFVDDEIYAGYLVKESMKLIMEYKKENQFSFETFCTIVAEDQGISPSFSIPGVKVDLQLFAQGTDDASNVITFFLPSELEQPILKSMGDTIKRHWVVNILLDSPVREKTETVSKPEFTYKYNQLAVQKIYNLKDLQEQAMNETNNLIKKIIASILKAA